jgi:hypothetical protein
MQIEPIHSIIPRDEPDKYMRPEVMAEIIDEFLPEGGRGRLLLRTVTKSGCNDLETVDYENVTIRRFRHWCRLPSPEVEEAATITRKNPSCTATNGAITTPLCPDTRLRQAKIGGDSITGYVLLHTKPLRSAVVHLYASVGVAAWVGFTDENGEFDTGKLPPGVYRLEIDGWGSTSVEVDPRPDREFGGQIPIWWLVFMDNACVSAGMSVD